jgi:hypothetical protein
MSDKTFSGKVALVTGGTSGIHNKSIIGEVWEKRAGDWKLVYFQETKIK